MMKKENTPLVAHYLESLSGMEEALPQHQFYDRIIKKLEKEQQKISWLFPLKPVWMIAGLALLLLINTVFLSREHVTTNTANSASIADFAQAYDQQISTY